MHRDGRFREDLYYRLAEIVVEIPPLRQQVGDAALLAHAFARRFAQEHGRSLTLADDALRAIEAIHGRAISVSWKTVSSAPPSWPMAGSALDVGFTDADGWWTMTARWTCG